MQPDIDLSVLKGIHTPLKPAFFPPAVGWWVVLVTAFICLTVFFLLLYFWYQSPKQYSLRLLKSIQKKPFQAQARGVELDILLKRIALLKFKREEVASLSGQEWSDFLVFHAQGCLSKEQADFISSAVYLPPEKAVAIDEKKLYTAVKEWILKIF